MPSTCWRRTRCKPAYQADMSPREGDARPLAWREFEGGLVEIGHDGAGFAFDNEGPRHRVWLEPFALAARPINCGEYLAFIEDGGYRRPEFWLSAGWDCVSQRGWQAPLYWEKQDGDGWQVFTLVGPAAAVDPAEPVCHVSAYEAAAFAKWAGKRLPREQEWEARRRGACEDIGAGLGMDRQSLRRLSRLSRAGRRDRRVQRQVHGQPDGAARRLRGDAGRPHAHDLSQLLSARRALDVRRHSSGGGSAMNGSALAPRSRRARRPRGIQGCGAGGARAHAARHPAKFLYDARGSALFDADLRAAGILPHAHRDRDPARSCAAEHRRDWPAPAARWSSSAAARA